MSTGKYEGEFSEAMTEPAGWPEIDESLLQSRASYLLDIRSLVYTVELFWREEHRRIFERGVWTGSAAQAANSALEQNIAEMVSMQQHMAKGHAYYSMAAEVLSQTKAQINRNLEDAHLVIQDVRESSQYSSGTKEILIKLFVAAQNKLNSDQVLAASAQIAPFSQWTPPSIPPAIEVPLGFNSSAAQSPVANAVSGGNRRIQVNSVANSRPYPARSTPHLGGATEAGTANPPPTTPPQQPFPSSASSSPAPGGGMGPGTSSGSPSTSSSMSSSGGSPSTGSASSGSPTASTSSASGSPSTASPTTSGAAGAQSSNTSTASAAKAQPSPIQQVFNQSAPLASSAPAQSPAAPPPSAPAPTTPAGAAPTAGTGAGGGLSTSGGPAPVAGAPAGAAPPAAPPVPLAPPTSPAPPAPPPTGAPGAAPAGLGAGVAPMSATSSSSGAAAAPIPVSQARAERDAVLAASTAGALRRKNNGSDPLQRARHIGAALNVGVKDFGFFWVTAVTTDGTIVVANSYGIGYIPDGVRLPENVRMASADDTIPADERAKWATYPILAVQGWAQHHELQLRAVVATEEQFANFDPGVAKIILTAEDIPDDGTMSGRTRLEVISPTAAQQLSAVGDFGLNDLLPPAPTDLEPPADQTATLWFEVAKPLMSTNPQRSAAHLQAFITYANHAQELAVYRAHTAAEPADQRLAIADWVYWQHLAVIMNDAVNADASA